MAIKQELTKGIFWIGIAKYSGLLLSLGITAILARHISPAAFGTMAVATVIMAFLDIFTDLGIGAAIIQFKDLTKNQLNSLFMVGCGVGSLLAIGLFFLSTTLARYYNDIQLIPVCHCLSITLLFNAFNIVPNGLMLKNKRFKIVSLRTLSFQIISGGVAIWGACNGWGIYALLVSPVITSIGVFAVNIYNYPQRLIMNIDFGAVKKVWKYSSFQFLFGISNYFSRNIDKLIIGKYFSMSDLGYYDKSYRLMQLPLQNITFVITPVLHPILSNLQDDKTQLAQKTIKLAKVLSYISFPVGLILFFCASEIIEIVFGTNWLPAIPIFQILALSVPLQVILSTSGSLYLAAGKSNHLFYAGIINTAFTVTGFIIAASYFKTITSMAWAWDITLIINFISSFTILFCRSLIAKPKHFFLSFIPQCINSLIVALVYLIVSRFACINNIVLALIFKFSVIMSCTVFFAAILKQYNIWDIITKKTKLSQII